VRRRGCKAEHFSRYQRRVLQRPSAEHHIEAVLDRVDHVVHQPDVQPRVRVALQKCGTDPGRVVDADEDGYGHSQFALLFLLAALHECANARDPLNFDILGVLARHPKMARVFMSYNAFLLQRGELPLRLPVSLRFSGLLTLDVRRSSGVST
jgi:hypothetical protein